MVKVQPKNIAIGLNKGFVTTALKKTNKVRQARNKGRIGKRVKLIRQIVNEVCGFSSYEKRIMQLLKTGGLKQSKKALKLSKKALGTHKRAKAKRQGLLEIIRQQKKK